MICHQCGSLLSGTNPECGEFLPGEPAQEGFCQPGEVSRAAAGNLVSPEIIFRLACGTLGIPLSGKTFIDGKPCFKGGNGVCNQNGAHGGRSNLVCKREGIHYKALDTFNLT